MSKELLWEWLVVLLVLNVIPLGNETSKILSNCIAKSLLRADYLLHIISLLAFAWVFTLEQVAGRPVFHDHALQRFSLIVVSAALGFNLAGATLGIIVGTISNKLSMA